MINAVNSQEHARHAVGFIVAMAFRTAAYHADPSPAMRKHPLPAIRLSQRQARIAHDWYIHTSETHEMDPEEDDLAYALDLAAGGDEPEQIA